MITIDEAIRIGKEELKRYNYSGLKKDLNIEVDEDNSRWIKYIEHTPSMKKSLKGIDPNSKDYYAVYFGPKELQLGGDAWVLVNRKSGTVIHLFFGR